MSNTHTFNILLDTSTTMLASQPTISCFGTLYFVTTQQLSSFCKQNTRADSTLLKCLM